MLITSSLCVVMMSMAARLAKIWTTGFLPFARRIRKNSGSMKRRLLEKRHRMCGLILWRKLLKMAMIQRLKVSLVQKMCASPTLRGNSIRKGKSCSLIMRTEARPLG